MSLSRGEMLGYVSLNRYHLFTLPGCDEGKMSEKRAHGLLRQFKSVVMRSIRTAPWHGGLSCYSAAPASAASRLLINVKLLV